MGWVGVDGFTNLMKRERERTDFVVVVNAKYGSRRNTQGESGRTTYAFSLFTASNKAELIYLLNVERRGCCVTVNGSQCFPQRR